MIDPTDEQLAQLLKDNDSKPGPVRMLNLLRFRDTAEYGDIPDPAGDAGPSTGAEAYGRYGAVAFKMIEKVGGHIVNVGQADQTLIGPASEHWHQVVLVEYPSRAKFLVMLQTPEYRACVHHRTAGLEDTRLIATTPLG